MRVEVYRSSECDIPGIVACSSASSGVRICAEHTIVEGGQQDHHCFNQEPDAHQERRATGSEVSSSLGVRGKWSDQGRVHQERRATR
jgi:hypothetical protein